MTHKHYFLQLLCFLWLIQPLTAIPSLALPGCKDSCGKVSIPYPFGMGAGCFLNEWYEVSCHDGVPYMVNKNYGGVQKVLNVTLDPPQIVISTYTKGLTNRTCETATWNPIYLSGSPLYYFSNYVWFFGCGNLLLLDGNNILGGCTSTCDEERKIGGCYGINCCRFTISSSIQRFSLSSTSLGTNFTCGRVIVGDYKQNLTYLDEAVFSEIPMYFRWTIHKSMLPNLHEERNCSVNQYNSYQCSCGGDCLEGNPYIPNGCQIRLDKPYCWQNSHSRKKLVVLAVGGTSLGILFLAIVTFFLYKTIKKARVKKRKEKFFIQNGGLLLKQQLTMDKNMVDKVRFFTSTELDKATDNFNENRILGQGGQGTVYKGMLVDGRIVAVKKSKLVDENQVEQFINEVVVLSQINHRNVVKLLGCCLETNVPLLVYEFIPNGTLYDLLYNENSEFQLTWDMRLRIAIEASGALAYLHSATSFPIYHRDIKSSNILLDEKYRAKVADFGISRHVTTDQTHLTTMVKGTFGYLDPEYFQSNQFTEKSDVYSFGVVLVELLTRQKPISLARNTTESGLSLATRFLTCMKEDQLSLILDGQMSNTASVEQLKMVAILAQQCLNLDGKKRPTMKEVAMKLESIRMSALPLVFQQNFEDNKRSEMELASFSDGCFSSVTSNVTVASSSDINPLLTDTF